jgi:hypothetical protein
MPNTAPYDANFTVPGRLHVDRLSFTGGLLTIYASTTNPAAECPVWQTAFAPDTRMLH